MLELFSKHIKDNNLLTKDDKIILAVSGGIDSMVMAELFYRSGCNFAIAHCNFGLRGAESNRDELFVAECAKNYGVDFYVKNFKTREYAGFNKISVQMAARDLRFDWFDELLKNSDYKYVATAHHLDDQIETFFINLVRGTGISGLHGIYPSRKNIIHPMLFVYRWQIEKFAEEEAVQYCEDSTNKSVKYLRNKIRHDLIPVFNEMNPEFRSSFTETIEKIKESEILINTYVEEIKKRAFKQEDNIIKISIDELIKLKPLLPHLFELLHAFNFKKNIVSDIVNSINDISGKQFFSSTHRIIKDRNYLIIDEYNSLINSELEFFINKDDNEIKNPIILKINKKADFSVNKISKNANIATLDYDLLEFPLTLRKWKNGDSFVPFGMKQSKKLSDFFIDNKFSIVEKENVWLLLSGKKIVWVIGHRISNLYQITDDTKNIIEIELIEN